ncbi:MAG: CPBP family intramembrane metalloprotease [Polyangiaceae bacterium]|nr:CPBP family intramembrane metalloprotease [Polyangiaceae bacterium]
MTPSSPPGVAPAPGGPGATPPAGTAREIAALAALAALWFGAFFGLRAHAWRLLPASVAALTTEQSYMAGVQLTTLGVGVVLALALVRRTRATLGLVAPPAFAWIAVLLAAPVLYSALSWTAFQIALPTLIDEHLRGGQRLLRANAGEFTRSIAVATPFELYLSFAVVAPVAEELMFRGALWSAVRSLTLPLARRPAPATPPADAELALGGALETPLPLRALGAAWDALARGGLATLASAGVFAWMHADLEGGAGIVRVVSTALLGLFCGIARQWSGSVWAAAWLHVCLNVLALGAQRKWLVVEGLPMRSQVPTLLLAVGVPALVLLLAIWAGRALLGRRGRSRRDRPREVV